MDSATPRVEMSSATARAAATALASDLSSSGREAVSLARQRPSPFQPSALKHLLAGRAFFGGGLFSHECLLNRRLNRGEDMAGRG